MLQRGIACHMLKRVDRVGKRLTLISLSSTCSCFCAVRACVVCVVFEDEPDSVLDFALAVIQGLKEMNVARAGETPIEVRAGVCTGPAYGGVIGSDVPRFHMFGPAHDGSILLEQNGRAMSAMVSAPTFHQSCTRYVFEKRPDISCEGMPEGVWQLMGPASNHVSAIQRRRSIEPTATTAASAGLSSHEIALRIAAKAAKSSTLSSAAGSAATSVSTTPASKNGPKQGGWV